MSYTPHGDSVDAALAAKRKRNNPRDKPVGHHTGRCKKCGSRDLWDDNHAYGCRSCGEIFIT